MVFDREGERPSSRSTVFIHRDMVKAMLGALIAVEAQRAIGRVQ